MAGRACCWKGLVPKNGVLTKLSEPPTMIRHIVRKVQGLILERLDWEEKG